MKMNRTQRSQVSTKIIIYIILFIQDSSQFTEIISNTEEINDFDYKRMINDFETSARHQEQLKKIKKKIKAKSKKYEEAIQRMKEIREETYKKRNNELKQKIQKKEEILITTLQNKEKNKMREKEKAIANMIERENQAKKNVEQYLEEQEKNRLEFQKVIQERSK